jgi:glycosyltransferase involved in cell wall biosynthesis
VRVAIDGDFLARPLTGSGRYLQRLLVEFARPGRSDRNDVRVFGPPLAAAPSGYTALRPPLGVRNENVAKVLFEQFALPRAAAMAGADLLHYPFFAAPLVATVPVVVTVHDLIPMILPAYRAGATVRLYTALVAAATRRAKLIVADSAASRDDIVRHLGVPAERVRVVLLAADERFRPCDDPGALDALRARLALPERFILYLGGLDERKNVPRLVEAYALARRMGLDLPLVIAGRLPAPSPLFPDVRGPVERLGLGDHVVFCGPGTEADTSPLYQAATAFVYPSTYEGFGLPPLEAMACGTPVVCSNNSSLPEVVGDAALTVDPTSVEALASALTAVGTDADLRESLRARGLARAATFSWERAARETEEAYAAALGRPR